MRTIDLLRCKFVAVASLAFAVCATALPYSPARASADRLSISYESLLAEPTDVERLHAYAEEAIRSGDFEAAIGILEGILVSGGEQARVLLELGALYRRLGAERSAQAYLDRARAAAGSDTALGELATEMLDSTRTPANPNQLNAFVDFGLRWQSNPTLAPETAGLFSGGLPVPQFSRQSDINLDLFSWLEHRYLFDERRSFDTEAVAYATFYDRDSQLDTALLEVSFGPSYSSALNAVGQWRVRPHLLLRGSILDGQSFEHTGGIGLDVHRRLGSRAHFIGTYQFRDVNFADVDGYDASDGSGDENRLDLRGFWEFAYDQLVMLRVLGLTRDAEQDYFDVDQLEVTLRYSLKLTNPLPFSEVKLTISPFVARRALNFGSADTPEALGYPQREREWRFGLDAELPLGRMWSAILRLEHSALDSRVKGSNGIQQTYRSYETKNDLVLLGLRLRF